MSIQGLTQNLVKDYKLIADKSLIKYFDSSVAAKVLCNRFTVVSLDKQSGGRYFYNENKNKRLPFSIITFAYSIFDKALNDDLYFYVSVDKNKHVVNDSILKKLPSCIRNARNCDFISSDSAKQIAIADSIKYADDLSSQLERNKYDQAYYWIITGHQPSERLKASKPSLNVHAETISTSQRRIINAQTGHIISYEQFEYDW